MPLHPGSQPSDGGAPEEYQQQHPGERPEQWGWHGEWGRTARIGGWLVVIILLVMITATHYNFSGAAWLVAFAAALVAALTWDAHRRRNTWRR